MALVAEAEATSAGLEGEHVAVLGYGSQGRAQALNLRDSGVSVTVGLRSDSPRASDAAAAGLAVSVPERAVAEASMVAMLIPDETQPFVYERVVSPNLAAGGALVFAHGFNVHYGKLRPRSDLDVILVAPLGIGEHVRAEFEAGRGTAGLVAVHRDATGRARGRSLGYAHALGHHRAAVIETTFAEETETDLFAEQAVLVGGLTQLVAAGFDTLVEAGYQPEIAYFCCVEEVRFMAGMLAEQGLARLWERISSTAAFGGLETGPRIVNEASRAAMHEALAAIRSGEFTRRLDRELNAGGGTLEKASAEARAGALEAVRRRLYGGRRKPGGPGGGEMAS